MKLTIAERWILSNQLQILGILDNDQKDYYKYTKEIIDSGYELLYDESIPYITDGDEILTEDQGKLVRDTLIMFEMITRALQGIDDKTGINLSQLKFAGFDGNNEGKYLAFAKFLCREYGEPRFLDIGEGFDNYNSHCPVLDAYKRMLTVWENSTSKYSLTKQDLIHISEAAIHTSNR